MVFIFSTSFYQAFSQQLFPTIAMTCPYLAVALKVWSVLLSKYGSQYFQSQLNFRYPITVSNIHTDGEKNRMTERHYQKIKVTNIFRKMQTNSKINAKYFLNGQSPQTKVQRQDIILVTEYSIKHFLLQTRPIGIAIIDTFNKCHLCILDMLRYGM